MTSLTTPIPLEYARSNPLLRRRGVRIALFSLVIIAFSVAGWRFGPRWYARAAYQYAEYRCRTHALPPDVVVYDEDPLRAAELLKRSNYTPLRQSGRANSIAGYSPACWQTVASVAGAPANVGAEAILYLGERTSQSGNRRIVVAHIYGETKPSASLNNLTNFVYPHVVIPATAQKPASVRVLFPMCGTGIVFPPPEVKLKPMRFYAGQSDPHDPSHFTIDYELPEGRGTIDGYLTDADIVRLTVRDGPAKDRYILYDNLPS